MNNSIHNGLSDDEAAKEMRKNALSFGDPDHVSHYTREDRPLPYKLKNWTNIFV